MMQRMPGKGLPHRISRIELPPLAKASYSGMHHELFYSLTGIDNKGNCITYNVCTLLFVITR